jgi:hypothetical protein
MESFWARLERARRVRTLRRFALLAAAAIVAAWFMPSILRHTAAAVNALGEFSDSYVALFTSPAGWAVSTLIAFAVLLRTGTLRLRRPR